ncbi:polyketide synthase [Pochonia chlamydosporia 170]|uniref:Polyketide synthase n=1 Tax=Pochonia chlamydosporia 170 TaxID=1380566 RepID=A0A179FE94_METCM|nr:polyketide synthase [Pochonia chlamydosporia 170]OAQ63678.2 polyketide synthase [Pochonia chlamydosporia 170]
MSLLLQPSGGIAFPQNDIMLEDLPSAQDPNGLLSGGATVSDDAGAHSIDASSHARINDNETSWRINGQANITSNDTDIHSNGADGHASVYHNGTTMSPSSSTNIPPNPGSLPRPVAICGMALRLPGGLESPQELWEFLLEKGDARCQVPKSRYNIDAYHSKSGRTGTIATQYGYFLDESIKLGGLDTSRFSLSRAELEVADPQHRRMLEVVREVFDDAGEIDFKSKNIGCYMGSYGEDWMEMQNRDHQQTGINRADGYSDFMLSSRISYEMDLKGPCMTIRTACSAALICVNEAFHAIQTGLCDGAIVGGSNLIMAPGMTSFMTEKGILSPDGHCKTFSADADGYARGEAVTAVYIKPLDAALRDGNPIRAVIRNIVSNSDGKTQGITKPSTESQEALMRKAYRDAGISDYSKTAFVECHGTGTPVGDPIETNAVANVFGDAGVYIGSVKPNLGHSEGASGLTSLIKGVLTLENRIIPPNIKFTKGNPDIPFEKRKLTVPLEPTPWPQDRLDRVSINSFGIGGSNAHAILESAQAYNVPERFAPLHQGSLDSRPHLLLFSAASSSSLKSMTDQFRPWMERNPDKMDDLAYTLAMRRENLPHRSFMVASPGQIPETASQGRRIGNSTPNLVMVFTGQGAQWPRMGRELLLRQDSVFQSSIRALDEFLGKLPDAPEWTIEEELLKLPRKSRVQSAELSQPLCTAVQIGLVDLFKSLGVEPYAVVGHSSGEVAAAYAAGVITAREAIIIAWQRGLAAKQQSRLGAMAAIGLGRTDVEKFLSPPSVVIACENSPGSVTISGDADAIETTLRRIHEELPDITARLLKVDKAYHSNHMAEVGEFYTTALRRYVPDLFDNTSTLKSPETRSKRQALFFSSVSGAEEPAQLSELRGTYWQRNLESPVLFRSAIQAVLNKVSDAAFLEIGPHTALAGPVRQTVAESPSSSDGEIPYFGAMSRGENCEESFLASVGQLFELNIPVDYSRLVRKTTSLPGLPHYPWDHTAASLWRESRISHEWRHRQFPAHPLLGIRQLESTTLEPSFRNMLLLKDTPWLRDHCIEGSIIFPCAGYIAMIGEGIRQITASQPQKPAGKDSDSFVIRNMLLNTALILREDTTIEIVTTFRPVRLTDSLDSTWWQWMISSYNGSIWTKHCSGEVTVSSTEPETAPDPNIAMLPRKVDRRKYYDVLNRAGISYGATFQRLNDLRTGTLEGIAAASLDNISCGDEEHYNLHPAIIDACIQSGPVAAMMGKIEEKHYRRVPTKIGRIVVHRVDPDMNMNFRAAAFASFVKGSSQVSSRIQCISNGKILLDMQGAILSMLETDDAETAAIAAEGEADETMRGSDAAPKALAEDLITSRFTWAPHIDFLDCHKLIRPSMPWHIYTPMLDEMARLCFVLTKRRLGLMKESSRMKETLPEQLVKYMTWIDTQVQKEQDTALKGLDDAAALDRIDVLLGQMRDTPVEDCATAIEKVLKNIDNIFTGSTDGLEMLLADNTLTNIYTATDASNRSGFISHLAHSKPNLRILEIGAGTGASTASFLKHLILPVGHPLYSKYTFTDISSGFFVGAKERLEEQGFKEDEKYDLIIATNVLHATKSLHDALCNARKLLDHRDGRLLLHELNSPSKWPNYIFGLLAGWWYGAADGRPDEPYVTPERWGEEMEKAGFDGLEAVVRDAEQPYQLNATILARAKPRVSRYEKEVILLQDDESLASNAIVQRLNERGYGVTSLRLGDTLPEQPHDIISLVDTTHPVFEDIDSGRFAAFQSIVQALSSSGAGMLWVTHLCQVNCKDPRYAQTIGTARTVRTESLIDFATCEVDDVHSSLDRIVDVFERFRARPRVTDELDEGDALDLRPDYEYAIVNGIVSVGRMFPVSIRDELSKPLVKEEVEHGHRASHEEARVALDMTKPGRLNTLHWRSAADDGDDGGAKVLKPDEVEVKIFAAGLNFKDVLGALGVIPYPEDGLGLEGAGIITRVGVDVTDLQPGNRVMFLADGSFASHVTTPAKLCERIPLHMSYEDAASMPAVFSTAFACLLNIGQLKKGQSILIHSAAGGVGLAAVQLAKMVGAEIYATVGNDDKANYLVQTFAIPRNHIFNSRNTSFVEGLMRETGGRGVDLALNSLSGELLHATWRCVAEFGKLVEIGKRDFLGGGKLDMDVFLGSRSYSGFYLDAEMARRHDVVKDLLHDIVAHFERGLISSLSPKKVFPMSSIQDGFRHLQQGTHIGKIVFSVRQPDGSLNLDIKRVVRNRMRRLQLDPSASYLLVGGLGGLGRSVARHLVEQGARSLVFLSRSAGSGAEDADTVRELEGMGSKVQLIKGSVVSEEDVVGAVQQATNLKGIIQASMVLRDENITRMSLEQWNQAVAPKVRGTWNLHNATVKAGIELDFFVLFSSMSGVTGQAGQANYAGANTFLDSFVQYRTSLQMLCSAIDIGAVQDIGYVSQDEALLKRMKATSAHGITEEELMETLSAAILLPRSKDATDQDHTYSDRNTIGLGLSLNVSLSDKDSRAFWRQDRRLAVYHNNSNKANADGDATASGGDWLKTFLARARSDTSLLKTEESANLLAIEIGKKLFGFLLKPVDELNTSAPLSQLGLDSLVSVEMRSWWRQAFGFDIRLLELLGMGTLDELGRHAVKGLLKLFGDDSS